MQNRPGFSCFVIGQDTLLIECTEILLGQGHQVKGVISSSPRIAAWASEKGLSTIDPRADYGEALAREPFDYLFSITHLAIIPEPVIALAKKGAINFHDGPLPRYAGLNAPAWALLQKETTYGITWHLMATSLDTGSILKQVNFEVSPDETSLSLNTKCFAHAIDTFGELVTELASGSVTKTTQDLSARSYFGRHQRPEAACLIDWNVPAVDLAALVRALDFGDRYPNPLGVAKVIAKGESFVVMRAEARPGMHNAVPGSIVFIDDHSVGVATGDGALALIEVSTLAGERVSARELVGRSGVDVGWRFESLSKETRDALSALDRELGRAEPFWVQRIADFEPWEAPYAATSPSAPRFEQVPLVIPERCAPGDTATLIAAFILYVARMSQTSTGAVGLLRGGRANALGSLRMWAADVVPLAMSVDHATSFRAHLERVTAELAEMETRDTFLRDVVTRHPELSGRRDAADGSLWPVCITIETEQMPPCRLALVLPVDAPPRLAYDTTAISESDARAVAHQLDILLASAVKSPDERIGALPVMSDDERTRILVEYNRTTRDHREGCIHHLIEEQAARTPDAVALVSEQEEISYRTLNERANQWAAHLRSLGVGPDSLVGIHVDRSIELVVAALAVLKAGGAYVPLDPEYPAERIAFMLRDAKLGVVVAQEHHALAAPEGTTVVRIDADGPLVARHPKRDLEGGATPENLAYVIYTSGSTGTPKGVMVEHRNVMAFFAGMDDRIPHDPPGTWLAVTSLSFDISVLELFWTLARGFRVVIHRHREREAGHLAPVLSSRAVDFSLFYFASDESESSVDKYELLLKGAKFADEHGFVAVWTPERHFHAFGGLYPNPAVTGAAVAVLTQHVQIRAGSVVLPLHHPVRVVEAWSIVDNLSRGRVGISFASGWQPNDFLLRPESFKDAKGVLFRDLEVVKALWRGEEATFPGAAGTPVTVRTLPRPMQAELPVWITTAGNVETYKMAGRVGANVLTHLLGQSISDLAPKIDAYRAARREHGHDPDAGVVSLMLHTFLGDDPTAVRAAVREPLKRYLGSSLELLKQYAWAFPAFTRPKDIEGDKGDDLLSLSDEERDAMLEHAFGRYYESSGLFGRPEDALRRVGELAAIGVDEIACLIDFGVPTPVVLEHLTHLDRLRGMATARNGESADSSIAAEIRRHRVTHLQCTPSMARMLLEETGTKDSLALLRCWMIGGEALSADLARAVRRTTRARLIDMYGPTETTVWSTTHELGEGEASVPIGKPIANTLAYVLDPRGEPVPVGVPGELYLGGAGVARGYLFREGLTSERFLPDPFARIGKMYRTGDLARFRSDGALEYVGRRDHQVKIRGHRVELAEIESVVAEDAGVARCVAIVREDTPGDQRLVVYVVGRNGSSVDTAVARDALRMRLPEFMVPSRMVVLPELPYTPNGKIDRKALPAPPKDDRELGLPSAAPASEMEIEIAKLWQEVLGREQIGTDDNFFDVGGHSLLVVRLHRKLRDLAIAVTLTDLYRFPTIRSLTRYLADSGSSEPARQGTERASIRREMSQRRRARQVEE